MHSVDGIRVTWGRMMRQPSGFPISRNNYPAAVKAWIATAHSPFFTQTMAPAWVAELPPHINLTPYQVERLELVRLGVGACEAEFHLHVRTHPECVKRLQRQQYELAKVTEPGMPNDFYLTMIVMQRFEAARLSGGDLFGLRAMFADAVPADDVRIVAAAMHLIEVNSWSTIDDVADAINESESVLPGDVPPDPRTSDARRQVTLILQERTAA